MTHAYYGEYQIAYLNLFSNQGLVVGTAFQQVLGQQMRYDHNFTFLGYIQIVDETAREYLYVVHIGLSGECAVQVHIAEVLLFVSNSESAFGDRCGYLVNNIGELTGQKCHILLGESHISAGLVSVIGLRSYVGIDLHGVGGKSLAVLVEGVHQSVSGTQQHDYHKDAPCHGESGQAGTQLVAPYALPYFG